MQNIKELEVKFIDLNSVAFRKQYITSDYFLIVLNILIIIFFLYFTITISFDLIIIDKRSIFYTALLSFGAFYMGKILFKMLYNPNKGLLEIRKREKFIIIRKPFKTQIIGFDEIKHVYCSIEYDEESLNEVIGVICFELVDQKIVKSLLIIKCNMISFSERKEKEKIAIIGGSICQKIDIYIKK